MGEGYLRGGVCVILEGIVKAELRKRNHNKADFLTGKSGGNGPR